MTSAAGIVMTPQEIPHALLRQKRSAWGRTLELRGEPSGRKDENRT